MRRTPSKKSLAVGKKLGRFTVTNLQRNSASSRKKSLKPGRKIGRFTVIDVQAKSQPQLSRMYSAESIYSPVLASPYDSDRQVFKSKKNPKKSMVQIKNKGKLFKFKVEDVPSPGRIPTGLRRNGSVDEDYAFAPDAIRNSQGRRIEEFRNVREPYKKKMRVTNGDAIFNFRVHDIDKLKEERSQLQKEVKNLLQKIKELDDIINS